MPGVLVAFRRQYPAVGLRVEVNNWQLLLERLLAEDIEFFVSDVRDLPVDPAIDIRSVGRQPGTFYARRGHPLAQCECTLAEVWSFGIAATRLPASVKSALAALLGLPAGETPTLGLECDDISLLRRVALETDTILASTDAAVRDEVGAGTLVRLQVKGLPQLYSRMGLVTLRNRTLSPSARRVIVAVEKLAAEVNVAPD
jgi:DNA-binding transcriptional LysR family regulator